MSSPTSEQFIPVTDVDQAFPSLTSDLGRRSADSGPADTGTPVRAALRDVLGWRPRVEDPKAFTDALRSSFRLRLVEGHVQSEFVPRGYAVQADLGAVTGGQASLYRRAQVFRTEMFRILDGLTALRPDADRDDTDAYRTLVRSALGSIVDEIGAPGGPRLEMVDSYLMALTGSQQLTDVSTPDTVGGQLGALRERFGLVDQFVNTVEEEGIRTSFWTLSDMVGDLQSSWAAQRLNFGNAAGRGFLGTELILLSRLMEAAADQVEELESILDSVLVAASERRTFVLDPTTGLTLDGLLGWLRGFLTREGRTIAQDTGRDGIVSALTPTLITLVKVFQTSLATRLDAYDNSNQGSPIRYLPTSFSAELPAGMYAARTRIAVAGLGRLLLDLARTAQRIGRWPGVVLLDVGVRPLSGRDDAVEVEFRGLNLRPTQLPAFVKPQATVNAGWRAEDLDPDDLVRAYRGSTTANDESITGIFDLGQLAGVLPAFTLHRGALFAAQDVPAAVIDGETGRFVIAPTTTTWPDLAPAATPQVLSSPARSWRSLPTDQSMQFVPEVAVPRNLTPEADRLDQVSGVVNGFADTLGRRTAAANTALSAEQELGDQTTTVADFGDALLVAQTRHEAATAERAAAKDAAKQATNQAKRAAAAAWVEHTEARLTETEVALTAAREDFDRAAAALPALEARRNDARTALVAADQDVEQQIRSTVAIVNQK